MQRPLICTAWQNFGGRHFWSTTRAALAQKPPLKNFTTTNAHVPSSTLDVSTTLFTSQQHGRSTPSFSLAASQAVRLSLRAGNIADAFRVVNAARGGGRFDEDEERAGSIPASFSALHTMSHLNWILPNTSVVPLGRLPTHTLLHGLVRLNKPTEAARLVDEMMKAGMKVRRGSLEAVFASLGKRSSEANQSPQQASSPSPNFHSNNVQQSETLGLALTLLQTARKTRTRRTHRMVKTLLALALLNGEIVLASLLFGGLVREWRGRKVAESMRETSAEERKEDTKVPYPAWSHLAELCGYIDESVEVYRRHRALMTLDVRSTRHPTAVQDEDERYLKPPDPPPPLLLLRSQPRLLDMTACHEPESERFSESIQALANVAGVLLDGSRVETEAEADRMREQDHQKQEHLHFLLPFGGLAGLIKILYRCLGVLDSANERPRTKKKNDRTGGFRVRIREHDTGRMKSVEAGKYLREVMRRFVMERLPSSNSDGTTHLQGQELTQQTYNTLLYYALVHAGPRKSREMADRVLESMAHSRRGSNQVTMNIIEGVAKRGDKRWREERRRWVEGWKVRLAVQPSPAPDLSIASLVEASSSSSKLDGYYTLSTKIGACVANGRPDVVAGAVPYLLPGLMHWVHSATSVDSGTAGSELPPTTEVLLLDQRKAAVMRAVRYGPVVMTSMLSALMKAGKTGLVEKVWDLAREAEGVSWDLGAYLEDHRPAGDIVVRPWCLGIEAYTVVIQAYANESKKVATGNDMVAGWGQSKGRRRRRRTRAKLGRHLGIKTSRLVGNDPAGESVLLQERLRTLEGIVRGWMDAARKDPTLPKVKIKVEPKHLQPLVPDVHFFNAVLDIFGRSPPAWSTTTRIRPRSTRCLTRKKARTRYLGTVRKYVWEGRVMGYYHGGPPDPRLREVVAKIRGCGFGERIPLLVKRILVGRGEAVELGGVLGIEGKVWMR